MGSRIFLGKPTNFLESGECVVQAPAEPKYLEFGSCTLLGKPTNFLESGECVVIQSVIGNLEVVFSLGNQPISWNLGNAVETKSREVFVATRFCGTVPVSKDSTAFPEKTTYYSGIISTVPLITCSVSCCQPQKEMLVVTGFGGTATPPRERIRAQPKADRQPVRGR